MPEIALALLAGILTVAAPCTLPVLPVLLGASIGQHARARPAFIALGFVLSFGFVALGLSVMTQAFDLDPSLLRTAGLGLLAVFGALMIWPTPFEMITARVAGTRTTAAGSTTTNHGNLSGFILGTTLGLVWTPCAGPVLGSILTAIATSRDHRHAAILLLVYAGGAALPMFAIAYGGQAVSTRLRTIARYTRVLQPAFGVFVIAFSCAAWLQYDVAAIAWLSSLFPEGRVGL